jgi:23S rRNA (uracil1939-C5)-methyltransferase
LTVRATAAGEVGLALEGGEGLGEPNELLESVAGLSAIWSVDDAGAVDWYAGAPVLADRWGTHEIVIAGTAFLQVNREVAAKLEDYVRAQCGDVSGLRVIDAYCGFGFRALELSWAGARVVGIDADHGAISVARSAAAESGAAARFHAHEVERALAWELPVELVLLNPPRRGLGAEVVGALLKEPPARVIYVSCDPATLARDLKGLAELYHIVACRCFDMFPQTVHVETVVTLERSGSP